LLRYEYETGERRVLERTGNCSSPSQVQGTVSRGETVEDVVRDCERTCPRLDWEEGKTLKFLKI